MSFCVVVVQYEYESTANSMKCFPLYYGIIATTLRHHYGDQALKMLTPILFGGNIRVYKVEIRPICHISHLSSTATHLSPAAAVTHLAPAAAATHLAPAAAVTHLAAAACISSFNYIDFQAYINYISFMFQDLMKLQISTSTIPAKEKRRHDKGKKVAKHKAVLPSLSSDDDHDEHDGHDDATPDVPDVLLHILHHLCHL